MSEYHKMNFGKYKGDKLDEIPVEYLVWLFNVLSFEKKDRELYKELLKYFLDQENRIDVVGEIHLFYLVDHPYPHIDGGERAWLQTHRVMEDSKGQRVFEVGNVRFPTFFAETEDGFEINEKYRSFRYPFGGETLVYERNPDYYFIDPNGKYFMGSFCMREAYLPSHFRDGKYSGNKLTKDLKK